MKIACVLIPHFALKCEVLRYPEVKESPCILVSRTGSRKVVLDFSPEGSGIAPGMLLPEALARCDGSILLEADVPYYHHAFERVLESLEQCSPLVEADGLGCAYVGLDGLEEMYGEEGKLLSSLRNAVPAYYFSQLGVAKGKFSAYAAAVKAEPGNTFKTGEDVRRFLGDLSVDLLPVPSEVRRKLHSCALHTLGAAGTIPVGGLQAQFGPLGRLIWELANGIETRPLLPRRQPLQVAECLSFPTPISSIGSLLVALDSLLERAFSKPEIRGKYARTATIGGQIFGGGVWKKRIAFKEPVGTRSRAFFVLRSSLETMQLPGPLEDISLTLSELTGEFGKQESIFGNVRKKEQLSEAVRRLEARLGAKPYLFQLIEVEPWSRIPERRKALIPFVI